MVVVMVNAGPMVMDRLVVLAVRCGGPEESVTVMLGLVVPVAVGVPDIAPEELMVRPAGRPKLPTVASKVPEAAS